MRLYPYLSSLLAPIENMNSAEFIIYAFLPTSRARAQLHVTSFDFGFLGLFSPAGDSPMAISRC